MDEGGDGVKRNVGEFDKGFRIFIGFILVAIGLVAPVGNVARVAVFVLGGAALLTGFINF